MFNMRCERMISGKVCSVTGGKCRCLERDGSTGLHQVLCSDFLPDDQERIAGMTKEASWESVKAKGRVIFETGGVEIYRNDAQEVAAYVMSGQVADQFPVSDGGPYEVILSKRSWGNSPNVGGWVQGFLCDCTWGFYHSGQPGRGWSGRFCSHAYALLLAANMRARGDFMRDRQASADYGKELKMLKKANIEWYEFDPGCFISELIEDSDGGFFVQVEPCDGGYCAYCLSDDDSALPFSSELDDFVFETAEEAMAAADDLAISPFLGGKLAREVDADFAPIVYLKDMRVNASGDYWTELEDESGGVLYLTISADEDDGYWRWSLDEQTPFANGYSESSEYTWRTPQEALDDFNDWVNFNVNGSKTVVGEWALDDSSRYRVHYYSGENGWATVAQDGIRDRYYYMVYIKDGKQVGGSEGRLLDENVAMYLAQQEVDALDYRVGSKANGSRVAAQNVSDDDEFALGDTFEFWPGGPVVEITEIDGNSLFIEQVEGKPVSDFPCWVESWELRADLEGSGLYYEGSKTAYDYESFDERSIWSYEGDEFTYLDMLEFYDTDIDHSEYPTFEDWEWDMVRSGFFTRVANRHNRSRMGSVKSSARVAIDAVYDDGLDADVDVRIEDDVLVVRDGYYVLDELDLYGDEMVDDIIDFIRDVCADNDIIIKNSPEELVGKVDGLLGEDVFASKRIASVRAAEYLERFDVGGDGDYYLNDYDEGAEFHIGPNGDGTWYIEWDYFDGSDDGNIKDGQDSAESAAMFWWDAFGRYAKSAGRRLEYEDDLVIIRDPDGDIGFKGSWDEATQIGYEDDDFPMRSYDGEIYHSVAHPGWTMEVVAGNKSASVKNATRHFTYAEMKELEDEIDGRELHNADRFKDGGAAYYGGI